MMIWGLLHKMKSVKFALYSFLVHFLVPFALFTFLSSLQIFVILLGKKIEKNYLFYQIYNEYQFKKRKLIKIARIFDA